MAQILNILERQVIFETQLNAFKLFEGKKKRLIEKRKKKITNKEMNE